MWGKKKVIGKTCHNLLLSQICNRAANMKSNMIISDNNSHTEIGRKYWNRVNLEIN